MNAETTRSPKPAPVESLASVPIIPLPACKQPRCTCHGHGSITFLAGERIASLWRHPDAAEPHSCHASFKPAQRVTPGVPWATVLWNGRPILHISRDEVRQGCRFSFRYDMATLCPESLRLVSAHKDMEVLCLFQPPVLTPFEAGLQTMLPANISGSAAGTVYSPRPLLLVQPDGWVLGGFLVRAALLRLKDGAGHDNFQAPVQPRSTSRKHWFPRLALPWLGGAS